MSKHIIMKEQQGASYLSEDVAPAFTNLELSGWEGQSLEDTGLFMFVMTARENAEEYPIHSSEDAWLAHVISGSGMLFSGNADHQKSDGVHYQAGDFISFAPNTPHGWKSDGEETRLLFIKRNA